MNVEIGTEAAQAQVLFWEYISLQCGKENENKEQIAMRILLLPRTSTSQFCWLFPMQVT
jgi:hypothetical protein